MNTQLSKFFKTSQQALERTIKMADELADVVRHSGNTKKLEFQFLRCVDDDERAMYSFVYGLCISKMNQEGDGIIDFMDIVGAPRESIVELEEVLRSIHKEPMMVAMEKIRNAYESGTIDIKLYFVALHSIGFIANYIEDFTIYEKQELSEESIVKNRESDTHVIIKQKLFEGWSERLDDFIAGVKFGYDMGYSLNFAISGVLKKIIETSTDVYTSTEEIVKTFAYVSAKAKQADININQQIADSIYTGKVLQLQTLKIIELLQLCSYVNDLTVKKVLTNTEGLAYIVNSTQYTKEETLFAVYAYSRSRDYLK